MPKRVICLSLIIIILFCSLTGRIAYIIFSKDYDASNSYNNYTLVLDNKKSTLYYRDWKKATNNSHKYICIIRSNPKCIGELNKLFTQKEINEITEELKQGYPVIRELDEKPSQNINYLTITDIYSDDNKIGNIIDKSSSGLKSYIDNDVATKEISFSIDANGRFLDGDSGEISDDNYYSLEGYRLSIDKKIQEIAINASSNLSSGVVLVMNVSDSSILACVDMPNETYLNKSLSLYSVGSVFKLLVASSALENGIDLSYTCNGSIKVDSLTFTCQKNKNHGTQNLKLALANSCNCYFVNLALELGKDKIQKTMEDFGFNDDTQLFDNWIVDNAIVPSDDELTSKGELSLLGFGQGKLTVTPLQIANMLCTIGNDGIKNDSRLVLGYVNNNNEKSNIDYSESTRVMTSENSKKLIEYMRYVVSNGTGYNAESSTKKSAGKTATAQTGQFFLTYEYLNTWFAGLYPYDNPQYAIVVMKEHGKSGSQDCCPIFRTIVEELEKL